MDWVKPDKNAKNKVYMRVPLKIVITGVFMGITRDSIELLVDELGGKKVGSVSGLTDYLITGYKLEDGRDFTEGSKYQKAKEKGIPCMSEDEFEQFIRD